MVGPEKTPQSSIQAYSVAEILSNEEMFSMVLMPPKVFGNNANILRRKYLAIHL